MKEEYGYNPFIYISTHPTLIKLKYLLGGIHHCVTVVGKWILDSNFSFELPLTKENLDYFCINDNEKKGINGYKVLLKAIRFLPKFSFRSENLKQVFDNIKMI